MKKSVTVLWAMATCLLVRAQEPGFRMQGVGSRELPVTARKMTNVIFPVDIAAGVRVSRDVLVQKVRGVENVIELKALKRGFAPTNLSVYGKDGRLYSFVLHYVEDTTVLDYRVVADGTIGEPEVRLNGWPFAPERLRSDGRMLADRPGFLRRRAEGDGVRLTLKGVFLRDSLLWLTFEVWDRAALEFSPEAFRMYTEDGKRVRRMASQKVEVLPVCVDGFGRMEGFGRGVMAVAVRPFLMGRGKRLVMELSDGAGGRRVQLRVGRRVLMQVRRG